MTYLVKPAKGKGIISLIKRGENVYKLKIRQGKNDILPPADLIPKSKDYRVYD
jgi:hypothetical protein